LEAVLYVSGGENIYKQSYVIVFFVVFILNLFMFSYLFIRYYKRDLIVDICDPLNLFGLAVSLRFNEVLDGKEILSPEGPKQRPLSTEWRIVSQGGKPEIHDVEEDDRDIPDDHSSVALLTPREQGMRSHRRNESV